MSILLSRAGWGMSRTPDRPLTTNYKVLLPCVLVLGRYLGRLWHVPTLAEILQQVAKTATHDKFGRGLEHTKRKATHVKARCWEGHSWVVIETRLSLNCYGGGPMYYPWRSEHNYKFSHWLSVCVLGCFMYKLAHRI